MTEDQKRYAKYSLAVTAAVGLLSVCAILFVHFDSKPIADNMPAVTATDTGITLDIAQDAKIISESIVIWGGESPGVDLGYLSQVAGFYEKHQGLFKSQHSLYSKELFGWQQYFSDHRNENKSIYRSDIDSLVGLVKSGKDHLESIVREWKKT